MPLNNMEFLDESVASIIQDQDEMGWDDVLFGAVHTTWSREQGDYLKELGFQKTGTMWVSQFMRKLWDLQHRMWIHRNSFVHDDKKSLHQHEEEAIDNSIREEFIIGRNGLDADYRGLFIGNVDRILNANSTTKVLWLHRVWTGRDRLRKQQDLDPWFRNPLASSYLRRNRVRRKRNRRGDVLNNG